MTENGKKNHLYDSPNHINKRIYFMGLDGGNAGLVIGLVIGISFFVSLISGYLILLIPIAVVFGSVVIMLMKPYEKRLREDRIDDPLLRDLEAGKFHKAYRDEEGLLFKL